MDSSSNKQMYCPYGQAFCCGQCFTNTISCFRINFFKIFFQEHYQEVKRLGSKLIAKVINRLQSRSWQGKSWCSYLDRHDNIEEKSGDKTLGYTSFRPPFSVPDNSSSSFTRLSWNLVDTAHIVSRSHQLHLNSVTAFLLVELPGFVCE